MNSKSIVEFIKKKYPKVVFEPIVFPHKKALGFIITDDKLIVGYIGSNGVMCKLLQPIDLSTFSNSDLKVGDFIKSLPTVNGFLEKDKERLIKLLTTPKENSVEKSKDEYVNIIKDLNNTIGELQEKLSTESTTISKLQATIDELKKGVESHKILEREHLESIANLNNMIKDLDEKMKLSMPIADHEIIIQKLQKQIKDLEDLNQKLQTEVSILPETITRKEHNKIVDDLQKRFENLENAQAQYKTYYDSQSNTNISIKKEYEDKITKITNDYIVIQKQLEECKNQIVNNKDAIVEGINKYKMEMADYIKNKELELKDIQELHKRDSEERKILKEQLKNLLEKEKGYLNDIEKNKVILSETNSTISEKRQKFEELQSSCNQITDELKVLKEELSKSKMKNELLEGYNIRCKEKLLNEKSQILESIKEYNQKWLEWSDTIQKDTKAYKIQLLNDLKTAQKNMKLTLQNQLNQVSMSSTEIKKLKQNIADVQNELQRTINEQIIKLSERDESIKRLEMLSNKRGETITELQSTIEDKNSLISERDQQIENLKNELSKSLFEVDTLIKQNNMTKIDSKIDYDNCYEILKNFISLNNIFYRKEEVITRLDNIIYNNTGIFSKLSDSLKQKIKTDYEKVKIEIKNHIDFLNLKQYVNSPNIGLLKMSSTRDRVPENFCIELSNLLQYWNSNKVTYRNQDRILSNIYEDLSGVARIYIRIKPVNYDNSENENSVIPKNIRINIVSDKRQRSLTLDCTKSNTEFKGEESFGDFYGIFEDTFTNLDVFTGTSNTQDSNSVKINLDNITEKTDSISPGLFHNFKQLEDGYSVVIFGYGNSGSGKTHSLLGSKGSPGLLHYGLSSLRDVSNISLRYLFEQYYNRLNFNNRQISGSIHNLIGQIPLLKDFSKDESAEFQKLLPNYINTKDITVDELYILTDIIDKYRIQKGRIKMTPINNVSSRSHLFLVFEIKFNSGKSGFLTITDMAGRESPMNIFNMFIDTSKTKLQSVMAPPPVGGVQNIQKNMSPQYITQYRPEDIFDILKEGFYTNETLNHLIYYLNKKNGRTINTPRQSVDDRYNVTYKIDHFFVQPKDEEANIDTINNCLTIPILKFLDNVSSKHSGEWKPTKFILLGCVRQELQYCDQTVETLRLLQKLLY